jgi:hypothetical protein
MSLCWNHSICVRCWNEKYPEVPVKQMSVFAFGYAAEVLSELRICCFCASVHVSGRFTRQSPDSVMCKGFCGMVP